jgi:cyclic pyranopterin monophosphate synthase
MMEKKLSHTDSEGKARMVDVGYKDVQRREAKAAGFIRMEAATLDLVRNNQMKKGDVLTVAELAGIQAAKQTSQLIPLAHNIVLDRVFVQAMPEENGIRVTGEVLCTGRTGAEMEALTAVTIALLTIYDMCKAVDKTMEMEGIRLIEKTKKDIIA